MKARFAMIYEGNIEQIKTYCGRIEDEIFNEIQNNFENRNLKRALLRMSKDLDEIKVLIGIK